MKEMEINKSDLIQEVLRQNWEHARHVEVERLRVTNFFILMIAGFLAYFGRAEIMFPVFINIFLLVLTVIAFLICIRLECEFHQHALLATLIAEKLGLGKCMGRPLDLYQKRIVGRWLSVPMFSVMYVGIFSGLTSMLIFNFTNLLMVSLVIFPILFFLLFTILIIVQKKQYDKISDECISNFSLDYNRSNS
jgi:hypothetical protein